MLKNSKEKREYMKIALIGMTGCGKSTIGKQLAISLNYDFVDVDCFIEQLEGKSIPEIFSQKGEKEFRVAESTALSKLINSSGNTVIACGGGIILREENCRLLKHNTFTVLLSRPTELVLAHTEILNRPPINGDPAKYYSLLKQRQPLYTKYANLIVDSTEIENAVAEIIKNINV